MEDNDIIRSRISGSQQNERAPRRRIFSNALQRGRTLANAFFKRAGGIFVSELKSNATPGKAAASFALGIFLGVFPVYGFQTAVAIFAAKLLKLNVPIAVFGTLAPSPFIIPTAFASVWLGSMIFASPEGTETNMQALMALFSENKPAFFAEGGKYFLTGGTILSVLGGGLAYVIAYPVCKMVQRKGKMP
ncbi:MAG: DUF2062 domain-containing protein [Chitinispirillia bacterium]|nr:DUF2062 domain-containing protein [Chitinispirillia bacterium]